MKGITGNLAGPLVIVLCQSGPALAGQTVWSPEDQPNTLVRCWINTKDQMGAGFPAFIWMLAVVGIGLVVFIVNLTRHRARMKAMKHNQETLTRGSMVASQARHHDP
jgi:hypothetical protein